jgi:hypothetical protein
VEQNQNTNEQLQNISAPEVKEEHPTSEAKKDTSAPLPHPEISTGSYKARPQTATTEVHHPQIMTHKKNWKEYLLEFFMLFLAVYLGFVAENIREHLVEKNREREFIQSMVADVKSDIKQLDSVEASRLLKQQMIDSILFILDLPDPDLYGNQLYYFARWMPRVLRIITSDGTMQQLRSGNLRLIRNRKAVDAILEYDQLVRFGNVALEDREESLIQQLYPSLKKLFDPRVFEKMVDGMRISRPEGNPKLLYKDKKSLNELYSHLHFLKNVNAFSIEFGRKRRNSAKHVLDVLQKEYHLTNE